MDAHQRLVADVDARGRATRLLRQDGNGRIYYTFTRWQVPIATDSGGGATAPPCRRQGDRSDAGWHAQTPKVRNDASGNTVPKDAENTIYRKSTTETCVTARTPNADIDQSGGYAGFGLLYVTVVGGYDQAVSLRFNHRMAKVEFTLMAGEGVTEEKRMK